MCSFIRLSTKGAFAKDVLPECRVIFALVRMIKRKLNSFELKNFLALLILFLSIGVLQGSMYY